MQSVHTDMTAGPQMSVSSIKFRPLRGFAGLYMSISSMYRNNTAGLSHVYIGPHMALFGCYYFRINPYVLGWIGVEYVDWGGFVDYVYNMCVDWQSLWSTHFFPYEKSLHGLQTTKLHKSIPFLSLFMWLCQSTHMFTDMTFQVIFHTHIYMIHSYRHGIPSDIYKSTHVYTMLNNTAGLSHVHIGPHMSM